ncbi:hypothetical protein ABWH91_14535 [Phycisphaerales bacterium ac7]
MPEPHDTPESTQPTPGLPVSQKVSSQRRIDPSIIREPLRRLRAKARMLLVVQKIATIGASLLAGLAVFTLVDFVLRFPIALRATVLVVCIGVLFWFVRTRIRPALRSRRA